MPKINYRRGETRKSNIRRTWPKRCGYRRTGPLAQSYHIWAKWGPRALRADEKRQMLKLLEEYWTDEG